MQGFVYTASKSKKEIFTALGSNFILKDKKLSVSWDNLLVAIDKLDEVVQPDFVRFETTKKKARRQQSAPCEDGLRARLHTLNEIRTHFRQTPDE